jgi:hypothetical protein
MQLTTTNRSGFAPTTMTEAMQFSEMLAKSQMVPKAYQGKPEDIMVAVQWGYEIGLAPMQALQNISVINGKPSVYGDAAMALVQASSVCDGVDESIEGEGTANPVAVCVARRKGRNPVIVRFSVEDAKRAGLWGKAGPWQAYPKRMLQMRARGFALRDAFPDVLKGLITAEEAQDYPDEAKPRPIKDVTPMPANPLDMIAPPAPPAPAPEPATAAPAEPETVEIDEYVPDLDDAPEAPAEAVAEPVDGYQLLTPGKDGEPPKVHATFADLGQWADTFVELMDKTGRAGKVPPRQRMTILREFRELNEATIQRVDITKKTAIIAMYGQRIRSLGAQLEKSTEASGIGTA